MYDYLYTLSLYDINKEDYTADNNVTDAEGKKSIDFTSSMYKNLQNYGNFQETDIIKIIDWLAGNDTNLQAYKEIINTIATEILNGGKNLSLDMIHLKIFSAIMRDDSIWKSFNSIDEIPSVILTPVTTPETDQEEAKKMPSDGFSIDNLVPTNEAGELDWTSPTESEEEAFETAKKKAKENLNNYLNSFYEFLKDTFDNDILQKALENVKNKYNNIIDNIELMLNGSSGPVTNDNYYYQYCAYGNVEDNKINDYCSKDLPVTCIVDDWSGQGDYPLHVLFLIDGEQLKNNIVDEYNSLLAGEQTGGTTSERR